MSPVSIEITGRPASQGIGIGKTKRLVKKQQVIQPEKINPADVKYHLEKVKKAKEILNSDFEDLKKLTKDPEAEKILEAQIQLLHDPELEKLINSKIENDHYTAIYAIFSSFNQYIEILNSASPDWASERTIDLSSIRDQFLKAIENKKERFSVQSGDIVFAEEISPTAMIRLSDVKIAGLVLQKAGLTSHAVILSQSLGIPCVIGAHWNKTALRDNMDAIVDGTKGKVILNPEDNYIKQYKSLQKDQESKRKTILKWASKPNRTKCGSEFTVRANIEFLEELPRLVTHGANGVGLLRTETLLFEAEEFNVNDQVEFYKKVVEASGDYPVTIRLFDAGGDKLLSDYETEANPFLGWRGIRMLLDNKSLLKKQLEAIYRLSGNYKGRVKLLVPMITGIEEIESVKSVCAEVEKKLKNASIPYDESMQFGVMIEVPSTVIMAQSIAKKVDFFSIGTNDLTQYTLAVDRGNDKISDLFDSDHPAIWKMIKMTVDAAQKEGIPVSVCGEMASKPEAAACLLGLGIKELSMNPASIPGVKSMVCNKTLLEMKKISDEVLKSEKVSDVHRIFKNGLKEK